jgi:hypothetical protein
VSGYPLPVALSKSAPALHDVGPPLNKPFNIPPDIARGFVSAMRDFFAEDDAIKRDAIAAHQLHVLRGYQGPRDKKLRLEDVKQMFQEMKRSIGPAD